jgi:curved DNA-binding protein CbpA
MKPMSEMTHYELLEIERDASSEEIERAYRLARATYSEDSLAAYSVYEEAETAAIRERIELAYRVLADADARSGYDAQLGGAAAEELPIAFEFEPEVAPQAPELPHEIEAFADIEEAAEAGWDGARLRRARLARALDIDRISAVTKINPRYLRCIEEESFPELPASVYVRGFVTAYARAVGLDPARVVASYMERVAAARPEAKKSLVRRGGR